MFADDYNNKCNIDFVDNVGPDIQSNHAVEFDHTMFRPRRVDQWNHLFGLQWHIATQQ
jgi:hypothetical protein